MQSEPEPFFIRQNSRDGRVLIEVGGECDAGTLDELNEALTSALASRADELVVDLGNTTFVDSLTLGALTAAAKRMRARGGRFHLDGASASEVKRALELTGLTAYLEADGRAGS